ncbi:hypothetical protein Esti_006017 [Eimeria stiedai]
MATPESDVEQAALKNYGAGNRFTPNTPFTPEGAAAAAAAAAAQKGLQGGPSPYALHPQRRGLTLADIRRRNLDEQQALRDEGHLKRYRFLNYSSEDSALQQAAAKKLSTFYCSCCGSNVCVAEVALEDMPQRGTDSAYVLQASEVFHKLYVVPSKRVILRRASGLEVQFQVKCRDCGVAVGYRSVDFGETAPLVYLYPEAICKEQSDAFAWQGRKGGAPSCFHVDTERVGFIVSAAQAVAASCCCCVKLHGDTEHAALVRGSRFKRDIVGRKRLRDVWNDGSNASSDVHGRINESPIVLKFCLAKPQPKEGAWREQQGRKILLQQHQRALGQQQQRCTQRRQQQQHA